MINIDEVVVQGTFWPGSWLLPEYHHHKYSGGLQIYDLVLGEMLTGIITFLGRTNPWRLELFDLIWAEWEFNSQPNFDLNAFPRWGSLVFPAWSASLWRFPVICPPSFGSSKAADWTPRAGEEEVRNNPIIVSSHRIIKITTWSPWPLADLEYLHIFKVGIYGNITPSFLSFRIQNRQN